jgi:hypothetical protein
MSFDPAGFDPAGFETAAEVAVVQARSGIARSGVSRAGYFIPNLVVLIGGADRSSAVAAGSLRIVQALNDEPDTCYFTMKPGFPAPAELQEVVVGLGTSANREFGGQVLRKTHRRRRGNESPWIDVSCVDYTHLFDRRLVRKYYANQSATDIVKDVIDTYTSGFTYRHVAEGLPIVGFLPAAMDTPSRTLRRIANRIGGGFYIDATKDVHFFGADGETGTRAPTAPVTLMNNLATLKAFSHEKDDSQRRTRVFAETKGSQTTADVAATMQAIPVEDGNAFVNGGGEALITEYGTFTYGGRNVFTFGTTVKTDALLGATSFEVNDLAQVIGIGFFPGWLLVDGRVWIYYTGGAITAAPAGNVTGIPSSGAGSITSALSVGDAVVNVPFITSLIGGSNALTRAIPQGTYIATVTERNDTAAQAALAAIEGGDGIHESLLRDHRFSVETGDDLADSDLTAFSTSLTRATWETEDMNARPGTRQMINLTGTDPLSVTLTITRAELEFLVPNRPPRRHCEASTVRLASVLDVMEAEQSR